VTNKSASAEVIDSGVITQLRWSADGGRLVYSKEAFIQGAGKQVWLHDFFNRTNILVSHTYAEPTAGAHGLSDAGDISADGRYVAYRSTSTNIVFGMTQDQSAVYLYDVQTGLNMLLFQGSAGAAKVDGQPLRPIFSGDGRSLCFASRASDFAVHDFNHSADLFAYSFLYAVLMPADAAGQDARILWPSTPGKNYRVEYKDDLSDANWHELSGAISIAGNKAWMRDSANNNNRRLYRIVSF
jgi:hypothetical protein